MKFELLSKALSNPDYMPILVHELGAQYGVDQRFVREKLVELNAERLITLSAWDENEGREKPFREWPTADHFFAYTSEGNHKRVRLTALGAEWLEGQKDLETLTPAATQVGVGDIVAANQMQEAAKWEEIGPLGEGGQSEVFLVRTPKRVAERKKYLDDIQFAEHQKGHHNPLLANAIWSYARPDAPSELGAMKRFKIRSGGAPAQERLKREIAILQESMPGLPRLLDANEGEQWIVTEYFPGMTLAHSPEKYLGQPLLALKAYRTLVNTVANALHKKGIVHRDIKPSNVFIGNNDVLVLGDFGIVFFPDQPNRPTTFGERVGPWECMQQWADTGARLENVQPNFDVYMLGKLLWCMVSGQPRLSREYHRQAPYNLENMFPGDRNMRLINSILDRCLVERPQDCLRSAADLLLHVDGALMTMENGKPIRDSKAEIIVPCRMCTSGFYKENSEGLSVGLQQVNESGVSAGLIKLCIFICDACSDRTFFEKSSLIKLTTIWHPAISGDKANRVKNPKHPF